MDSSWYDFDVSAYDKDILMLDILDAGTGDQKQKDSIGKYFDVHLV